MLPFPDPFGEEHKVDIDKNIISKWFSSPRPDRCIQRCKIGNHNVIFIILSDSGKMELTIKCIENVVQNKTVMQNTVAFLEIKKSTGGGYYTDGFSHLIQTPDIENVLHGINWWEDNSSNTTIDDAPNLSVIEG